MHSYSNQLINEKSPYLLQHAHNPVNWVPWGDAAFAQAQREDKPIFLSIGYATCHWCHVMAHESFENKDVAALLNEAFVCIKVDREERPDIDEIYMTVCQMLTKSGGWPLTIVMTPEKKPFFAGTYIPPENRLGRLGMVELIPRLSNAWKTRREEILQSASQITAALSETDSVTGTLDSAILDRAFEAEESSYDARYGGFGGAPKFPSAHRLIFLMRQNSEAARTMVESTLAALRKGGIWDHIGFGIHRYSTDREWLVPHFEKMLYDQAMLALACIEAVEAYGDEAAQTTVKKIFEYVLRDMTDPGGGFYSAEDADSEGVEGKFYVWSLEKLREVLSEKELVTVVERLNVHASGNFLDEATRQKTGDNILHLTRERDIPASIREKLFASRKQRIHPLKDTKVLADWNGLMIAALAKGGRVLDEPKYTAAAKRAADFIFTEMSDDGRLWHRWREGSTAVPGQLDDYAFMIFGLLELYETAFDFQWLEKAVALNEVVLKKFPARVVSDNFTESKMTTGGFYLTADDAEELIIRPKSLYDGALPSGNSVQMMNLLRLARLTGRVDLEALAGRTVNAFAVLMNRSPSGFSQALQAVQFTQFGSVEIVIVGDFDAPDTKEMIRAVRSVYLPNKVVLLKEPDDPAIITLAPYSKDHKQIDGKATVYICRNFACESPLTDPKMVTEMLAR